MMMEWVEGKTVKEVLVEGKQRDMQDAKWAEELRCVMNKIGTAIAKMHEVGVVHGDLTTSNMILRPFEKGDKIGALDKDDEIIEAGPSVSHEEIMKNGEIVLIDFGLAAQVSQEEDKAVDLYVLERAFSSTHPEVESGFKEVLKVYGESYKGAGMVLKRLEEVRMRGRKRSMVG